jgi:undecaprenyl phosphate N,N'-diacetylbacillosamine 1-phosphate transferase
VHHIGVICKALAIITIFTPTSSTMGTSTSRAIYINIVKSTADFCVATVVFLVLSPLFFVLVLLLVIANSGKPFFFQRRPGKNSKIFKVVKFKTMNDKRDAAGNLLPDADRLTAVGSFIRRTSLDEIPQLINVIKGDMSIVGPRPLLVEYLPLYNETQKRRHDVKPGITGWAQINGRNAISWKQKFEYDVWYVENISFLLDMKIILRTFIKVGKSEGISSATSATMEKFTGQ